MLNRAVGQEIFSGWQLERVVSSLDELLRIYTEALFVLAVVVLGLLVCFFLYEMRQSKTIGKIPTNHRSLEGRQLLQTGP
jgi:hypothetical protein